MCISDGVLRATLDGEIAPASFEPHVSACYNCRGRRDLLESRAGRIQRLLATLESSTALPDPAAALFEFRLRHRLVIDTLQVPWYRSLARPAAASSLLTHAALITLLVTVFANPNVQHAVKRTAILILPANISDYLPLAPQKPQQMAGGGGGGDRSPLPASKGKLPKAAKEQFTPPTVKILNENPKLAMDPTVVIPPEFQLSNLNLPVFGDPKGVTGPLSNGTGSGGGIGSGSNGGVGSGGGPGVGAGEGGGISGAVYHVGGGISAPQLIYRVDPEYSEEARKAKHQGTVELYVEVEPDGRAHKILVRRPLGLGLDEKAVEAVRQWRFKPALKNGKPVTVGAIVTVHFRLL